LIKKAKAKMVHLDKWKKAMKITFLGEAGTVTGLKYLLEVINKKILVDYGLLQWHYFGIATYRTIGER